MSKALLIAISLVLTSTQLMADSIDTGGKLISISAQNCEEGQPRLESLTSKMNHHIRGPLSIAGLEEEHMIEIRETGEKLPFGYMHNEWEKMKSLYQSGDEIYFISVSGGGHFENSHVLERGGCVILKLPGLVS